MQAKATITIADGGLRESAKTVSQKSLKASVSTANGEGCKCLFNPSEFSVVRSSIYAEHKIPGLDRPILQYINGEAEVMRFTLFFDTYSMGTDTQDIKAALKSDEPPKPKSDVRIYTEPFYKLLNINESKHAPDLVAFEWGSMKFEGYVTDIQQKFTMFASDGFPLRATLDITLKSNKKDNNIRNSPDRTKQRFVESGDRLYSYAKSEYGACAQWRRIAEANNMDNPRLLQSGDSIVIPAVT